MRFVSAMCHMGERGGQCVRVSERTLVVYNVPRWTPEMTARLARAYPTCGVEVLSHDGSPAGFKLLIHDYGGRTELSALVVVLGMLAATVVLVQQLLQLAGKN